MSDVTKILSQINAGDRTAADQLLPLVYDELRKLAAAKMAQEDPGTRCKPRLWSTMRTSGCSVRNSLQTGIHVVTSSLLQPRP